ncbi:MAG: flagellar motor protein MotA [Alphaproteobacteria bacterium]
MTRPKRFLTRMILFLVTVLAVLAVLLRPVIEAFLANPALNGLIGGVLLVGIVYVFRQVLTLRPEVDWIETYRRNQPGLSVQKPPVLLAPMAAMLGERSGRMTLSALSTRSLLDSISSRLDESRDISRYLIGLLIFLGLLGTFWGLLQTVAAVGQTIGGLSVESGDFANLFDTLQKGLRAPLTGMGTAFSSSLFGLSGSLVLGFLDLQASQAQNRFYNDLEEWLSSYTRLSSGGLGDGDQSVPAYVQALLEQSADTLDELQRTMARGEDSRASANATLLALAEKLAMLTDQMRTEQNLLAKLAEGQIEMKPVLQRLAVAAESDRGGLDEASRNHLRNLDVYVLRLLEETSEGRNQVVHELRSEIKLLARTIAAVGGDQR